LIHYANVLMVYQGMTNILNINRVSRMSLTCINVLRLQITSGKIDLLLYKDSRTDIFYVNIRTQRADQSM